jgi:hypothetical protein
MCALFTAEVLRPSYRCFRFRHKIKDPGGVGGSGAGDIDTSVRRRIGCAPRRAPADRGPGDSEAWLRHPIRLNESSEERERLTTAALELVQMRYD